MNLMAWGDVAAGGWLIAGWFGYAAFAKHKSKTTKCLLTATQYYQLRWMQQVTEREVRIADATSLGVLERMVSFFAATTILLLGGLLTLLLNRSERAAMDALAHLPFFTPPAEGMWELKVVTLMLIFVYAFFKFTWSLRQLGFTLMMLGGSPLPRAEPEERESYAAQAARLFYLGMNAFNFGLRAYYFAMGALAWFVHPLAVVGSTIWVVIVLYKREFQSKALEAMEHEIGRPWKR